MQGLREWVVAATTKAGRIPVDREATREDWRRRKAEFAGVRPISIDTAKDPRYRRERSAGHGSSAPYVPRRLGLRAKRTGRPAGHVPVMAAPKDPRRRTVLDEV